VTYKDDQLIKCMIALFADAFSGLQFFFGYLDLQLL